MNYNATESRVDSSKFHSSYVRFDRIVVIFFISFVCLCFICFYFGFYLVLPSWPDLVSSFTESGKLWATVIGLNVTRFQLVLPSFT